MGSPLGNSGFPLGIRGRGAWGVLKCYIKKENCYKFRRKSLNAEILDRMQALIKELLFKWECDLIEFGGGDGDHVHILFESHPSVDLSKLVNNIKTVTSSRLRSEYSKHLSQFYWGDKPQFWSGSYAIISVGAQAPLEKLIQYVRSQEQPEE